MTELGLQAIKEGDFTASASVEGPALIGRLTGNADMRVVARLQAWLLELHAEAERLKVQEVAIDVRQLEFMNSSCFKGFVTWIGVVQEAEPGSQYKIRFLSDPRMLWQRRSLHALSCFAADLISVDTH